MQKFLHSHTNSVTCQQNTAYVHDITDCVLSHPSPHPKVIPWTNFSDFSCHSGVQPLVTPGSLYLMVVNQGASKPLINIYKQQASLIPGSDPVNFPTNKMTCYSQISTVYHYSQHQWTCPLTDHSTPYHLASATLKLAHPLLRPTTHKAHCLTNHSEHKRIKQMVIEGQLPYVPP